MRYSLYAKPDMAFIWFKTVLLKTSTMPSRIEKHAIVSWGEGHTMGLIEQMQTRVHLHDDHIFTLPEGPNKQLTTMIDRRPLARRPRRFTATVTISDCIIRDNVRKIDVQSRDCTGSCVLVGIRPCGLLNCKKLIPLLKRYRTIRITCIKEYGRVVAALPSDSWFEAARAHLYDLPPNVSVIRAYLTKRDWGYRSDRLHVLEPLDVTVVRDTSCGPEGFRMNFYSADHIVASVPNKFYAFQRLIREYPDHILAATAETLRRQTSGVYHRLNVFVN